MIDTFSITVLGFPMQQFVRELEAINRTTGAFSQVQVPDENTHSFTVTPEAATILVTGVSSLVMLVNSILIFLCGRKNGTVRIVGSSGRILEFPKDMAPEKVRDLLEIAHDLDAKRIVVSATDRPDTQV